MSNSHLDVKFLQTVLLDSLKEFKKICDEEGITFFLRGGSVMGAVKYDGFVPWDDDMDIAIPRDQYEKMIEIFDNRVIADKYIVRNSRSQPELHCYYPRLFLLEAERERLGLPANTNLGVHLIDILPLDGAPDGDFARQIYFGKVYLLRFLASLGTNYAEGVLVSHTPKQKILMKIAKTLQLHKIFPQQKVYRMLDRLYTKYDWKKQKYAGTITASLFEKEVMPVEIWGTGVWHKFDDQEFLIPSDYDRYLKIMYGENYLIEEPDNKKTHYKENE